MAKELDLCGAFRWGIEFDWAVEYLSTRRVDVRPLLTGQFPLRDAVKAFELAKDKSQSTKVQVVCARIARSRWTDRANLFIVEEESCVCI